MIFTRIFTRSLVAAVTVTLTLTACAPVGMVIGGAAAIGLAAYEERGVEGVTRDLRTASRIQSLFFQTDHRLSTAIGIEVFEGRVLLTGQVESEDMRADAVRLTWQVDGVLDVLNEIYVSTDGTLLDTARDAWITTQLKSKLTFDDNIYAINYAVETMGATVYLIGIAQNAEELERVKSHAHAIDYVRRIVSHVRIKTDVPAGSVQN